VHSTAQSPLQVAAQSPLHPIGSDAKIVIVGIAVNAIIGSVFAILLNKSLRVILFFILSIYHLHIQFLVFSLYLCKLYMVPFYPYTLGKL
jgi:hypothetical protein